MAVHDQDMSSGKNGVKNAINAGRSAGKKLFSKGAGAGKMIVSKGASSALLSGPMAGVAVFFGVLIFIMIFMLMTMPMTTLNSTEKSYKKAKKFMEDQLYDGYDEAVKKVGNQIVKSASKPFDEGGYNCGSTTVIFGNIELEYSADFLNWGVTHDPNYRDENENYSFIRTEGEKIEVDEEGERPSDEERDKHKSACTIKVNFFPTLTQESGIIGAYVEAANGVIYDMPEEAYEEGVMTEDDFMKSLKTKNDKADELKEEGNIFESDEKYESVQDKYATKYNSISSDEFKRDFKAFIKHDTASYFYKGEYKVEDYSGESFPIFYALYNHAMFEKEEATESIISTSEEVEAGSYVEMYNPQTGQWTIVGSAKDPYAQKLVKDYPDKYRYSIEYKYYSTFHYEMEIDVPVLYDISTYRKREFDNLRTAFIEAGLDEDFYGEYVQDALDTKYEHALQIRGLKDEEEKYREMAEEAIAKFIEVSGDDAVYIKLTSDKTGHAFTGTPYNYYGLDPGGFGELLSDAELWAWKSSCPTFYSGNPDCIGYGSNGRNAAAKTRMAALAAQGVMKINFNYSCVEFAMMWCYDHYGKNYLNDMGDAAQIVGNLVTKHSDVFVETAGPYPGSIISITGGTTSCHIACVDRVWEENGKTMLEISDGNIKDGTAVRIRAVVSLDELASYWHMRFASPRDKVKS